MDAYERVTNTIVEAIEQGLVAFTLPWHRNKGASLPRNIETGNEYKGINTLNLWCQSLLRSFPSDTWGTYRQLQAKGYQVRKGERASIIVFYKEVIVEEDDGAKKKRVMRSYSVFNLSQTEGYTLENTIHNPIDPIEGVELAIRATGAAIDIGGDRASYNWKSDRISMPDQGRFFTEDRQEAWYSTLLHELTHWTGHTTRLDRDLKNRFGSEAYAMEELVAELGAAYLCARLGITPAPRPDHAGYIASWLEVLKNDKRAVFSAAARAQEAVEYIL